MLSAFLTVGSDRLVAAPVQNASSASLAGSDALLFACFALSVIALGAVAKVFSARREVRSAARDARNHSEGMRELLQTVRMAESIAGIGVWQYDHENDKQTWSEGFKRLFGVDDEQAFVEGDAETLLYLQGIDLVAMVRNHSEATGPFVVGFHLKRPDGAARRVELNACNMRKGDGTIQRTIGVVRALGSDQTCDGDVTDTARGGGPHEVLPVQKLDPAKRGGEPSASDRSITSELDALTGLAKRQDLMRDLGQMVVEAHAQESALALIIFGIDCSTKAKQTCAPSETEVIQRRVAQIAQDCARPRDLVGQVSEFEFAWAIPFTSDRMVRIMAERLRQAIARSGGTPGCPVVTVSIGYASLREEDSALSLFARADEAKAEAARGGRNRVRVAA